MRLDRIMVEGTPWVSISFLIIQHSRFTTFVFVSAMTVNGYIPAEGIFGAFCSHHTHISPNSPPLSPPHKAAAIELLLASTAMAYRALSALGTELPAGHRPNRHALPPPWFMYNT